MAINFQKPKAYDPSLAERLPAFSSAGVNHVQKMLDLGFDDAAGIHTDLEEKCTLLQEQLDAKQREVETLKTSLDEVRTNEARAVQKLQSFQQVNRSQNALMKAELQKTRRRLAHTQSVAQRLREQMLWYQAQSPALCLPDHLLGLPSEEEAAEEHAELTQLHERWEKDVGQLSAELEASLLGGRGRGAKSQDAVSSGSQELEEAKKPIELLELLAKKQKKEVDRQANEIESLRASGPEASASPVAASASSEASTCASTGASSLQSQEEVAQLRKELETAEEKAKEQAKKLKQLATAYKKLDQEKIDIEARLNEASASAELARAQGATPKGLPLELVQRVRNTLAAGRATAAQIRAAVQADLQQQLSLVLQEVMQSKVAELQLLMESGNKEWKEKYNIECEKRRKLHNLVQELKGNIRVYCRVRPMTQKESEAGSCISCPSPDEIMIVNPDMGVKKTWQFNEIFQQNSTQEDVFTGIRDLVVSMIDGFNVCIFAYGQTGSGKTHSMQGQPENPGIYMRTFKELFKVAKDRAGWKVELQGACLEIYNEEIKDLLLGQNDKKQKLQVRQAKDGNCVPGLTLRPVTSPEEVDSLLNMAQTNRTVAATDMNLHSSRSHLLVQIHGSMTNPDGKQFSSVITLVDLAGSERLAKSGVSGDRAKEAIAINKSLSALGDVINARATKSQHTPYRNSTLTHLLQDSLGGDSKTLMLLQLNPCASHVEESMCSLQFGARVNAVEMSKK